jgi:ATP-dependent DNA helicase 2 subunit 2
LILNKVKEKISKIKLNNTILFFNLINIYLLEQIEEKKKRVFWRDIIKQEMNEDLEEINKKRIQEKLENNKHEPKKSISFSSAIDDFKEMINYKYEDLTTDALEQMKKIIIKFILESFKGSYYIRALDCLKIMRESCIDEDEVDFFNNFLEILKKDFPKEKFMDFWKLLIDNKITLISLQENINSKYPEEEAIAWLNLIDRKEIITSTLNDLDKLIDDIE